MVAQMLHLFMNYPNVPQILARIHVNGKCSHIKHLLNVAQVAFKQRLHHENIDETLIKYIKFQIWMERD